MVNNETDQKQKDVIGFDLYSILEDIAQTTASQVVKQDLEVVLFIDPSTPIFVIGLPETLRRLITGLVGFSLKFADFGGIIIHSTLEKTTKIYQSVGFSVAFNGTSKFDELSPTIQSALAGHDSDNSVEKNIPDLQDLIILAKQGQTKIILVATPGKESKFAFTINFQPNTLPIKSVPEIDLKGAHILVADDNPASQQALMVMLRSMGYRVKAVSNGALVQPALVRGVIANSPYKALILDMEMPGMDGKTVLQLLRSDDQVKNTRVILLVPVGHQIDLDEFSKSDYSAVLHKPVTRAELRHTLESTLNPREVLDPVKQEKKDAVSGEGRKRLKVLLVEDNDTNLKMGTILFKHLGCDVETAFGGVEAVTAVEAQEFDLVFMDVQMPVVDGLEATRRIRSLRNGKGNVPIIAMTAHEVELYQQRCYDAGMNDFVSKPFDLKHIEQILDACSQGQYRSGMKQAVIPEPKTVPVEVPILDIAIGMHIFENDAKGYNEFIKEFLGTLPGRIMKMTQELNAGNWELLLNDAHNLKGISANLGLMKLSNLSARLENQAMDKAEEKAGATLHLMDVNLKEINEVTPQMIANFIEPLVKK